MAAAAPRRAYEVIVVGLGAHGGAALCNLAKWGVRCLGLERWAPGHANASHHGETRITRQAYAEGAEYVPMLQHSFAAYRALEREAKAPAGRFYTQTGVLNAGALAAAARRAAEAHGLAHEVMDAAEAMARFPGISLPPGTPVLFEEAGGVLRPEAMVAAHVEVAKYHGAAVRTRERVLGWRALPGGGARVTTDTGDYEAEALVLAAGAWMPKLVPELEGLVTPRRVTVAWFDPSPRPELYASSRLPVWLLQIGDEPPLYGFPVMPGEPGFKIGGWPDEGAPPYDPDSEEPRAWRGAADEAPLRAALSKYFPGAADGALLKGSACMFAMTPDGHFIIDAHPRHPQVVLCSACSGHGFKLAPAVGLMLAEMARRASAGGSGGGDGAQAADALPPSFPDAARLFRLDPSRPGVAAALERFRAAAA